MKKLFLILLLLVFTSLTGLSQTEVKAEKAALDCLDKTLSIAGKDITYILNFCNTLTLYNKYDLYTNEHKKDSISYEKEKREYDSVLTICGIYKADFFDISILKNCMLSSYDLKNKKNDTTSSYFKLTHHLIFLVDNPSLISVFSPRFQIETIKLMINADDRHDNLYKAISFILGRGIIREYERNKKSINSKNKNSEHIHTIEYEEIEMKQVEEKKLNKTNETQTTCEEIIYDVVEAAPEYNGGAEALKNYMRAKLKDVNGKVYVQFVIDCNGNVSNPRVLRGLTPEADKIALDKVNTMSKWKPAEQRGVKVNLRYTTVVVFE